MFTNDDNNIANWTPQEMLSYVKQSLRDEELGGVTKALASKVPSNATADAQVPIWNAGANQWVAGSMPQAGVVCQYAGPTAPSGWLLCVGTAVSRTLFSALFTAIDTLYGVGDGSTTFNIPDTRGRMPIGEGTGAGLTDRPLATSGGAETATLTVANMPSHSHGGATGTGNTGTGTTGSSQPQLPNMGTTGTILNGGTLVVGAQYASAISAGVTGASAGILAHTHTAPSLTVPALAISAEGSGTGHANVPTYITFNFIIKI